MNHQTSIFIPICISQKNIIFQRINSKMISLTPTITFQRQLHLENQFLYDFMVENGKFWRKRRSFKNWSKLRVCHFKTKIIYRNITSSILVITKKKSNNGQSRLYLQLCTSNFSSIALNNLYTLFFVELIATKMFADCIVDFSLSVSLTIGLHYLISSPNSFIKVALNIISPENFWTQQ